MEIKNKLTQLIGITLISLILLTFVEFGARLFGLLKFSQPWEVTSISPESPFLEDDLLGYKLKPGKFEYHYKNGYSYVANHKNGMRVINQTNFVNKPILHIYGDSFLYGMGLKDDEIMASILQKDNPNLHIENHAVLGYSLLTNSLLFSKNIEEENIPNYALFLLAGYDEGRITMNRNMQKNIYLNSKVVKIYKYPFVKKTDSIFSLDYCELKRKPFISKHSAVFNTLSNGLNKTIDNKIDYKGAMKFVLASIIDKCEENNTTPIFMYLSLNKNLEEIVKDLEAMNFITVNVNLNFQSAEYSLLPYDSHPNQYSNEIFANEVQEILDSLISKN